MDPYDLGLRFSTVQSLAARGKFDFIILLALVMDAKRNLSYYLEPNQDKVELFLGNAEWREEWREYSRSVGETENSAFVRFLAEQYICSMQRIGFKGTTMLDFAPIKSDQRNIALYYLGFFSESKKGLEFWRQALKYARTERSLFDQV